MRDALVCIGPNGECAIIRWECAGWSGSKFGSCFVGVRCIHGSSVRSTTWKLPGATTGVPAGVVRVLTTAHLGQMKTAVPRGQAPHSQPQTTSNLGPPGYQPTTTGSLELQQSPCVTVRVAVGVAMLGERMLLRGTSSTLHRAVWSTRPTVV